MELTAALPDAGFWRGKSVFLTGHTGFKGSWSALWLSRMGAKVTGFALPPQTNPALFVQAEVNQDLVSILGDLRDRAAVEAAVEHADPEIALLLGAQPIVRRALADPIETIATNVLGAAYVLSALRQSRRLSSIVMVTSDKVYSNDEPGRPFRESDPLGGKDPYSASKAAAEILTHAFAHSYFRRHGQKVATARAGNVLGGGDYGPDRLVPDIVRAVHAKQRPILRLPQATRPWQHVLDSLAGYFLLAEALHRGTTLPPALNFGPDPTRAMSVSGLTRAFLTAFGEPPDYDCAAAPPGGTPEMQNLAVDAGCARESLNWQPRLPDTAMVDWTAAWYRAVHDGINARTTSLAQIEAYEKIGR
jgi:CDP-glucose 4,6-dehydratase